MQFLGVFHPFIQRSLGVINLELTLFPWLHLYEGLSFGVGVAVVVEVVFVVVVEGVAPETVAAGVEAVETVVVGVEAAGTVVVEELVLETVALVEWVAPETVAVDPLEIVEEGVNLLDIVVD